MNIEDVVSSIELIIYEAKDRGLDHELILAKVYSKHLKSSESDMCHMYGITFATKLNELMESQEDTE